MCWSAIKMNTSLSVVLLWENEPGWGSSTFRSYKQLSERSQTLHRERQSSCGEKSQNISRKRGSWGERGNKTQLWKRLVDVSRITTHFKTITPRVALPSYNSCHPKIQSCQSVITGFLLWNSGAVHEYIPSCAWTFLPLATIWTAIRFH